MDQDARARLNELLQAGSALGLRVLMDALARHFEGDLDSASIAFEHDSRLGFSTEEVAAAQVDEQGRVRVRTGALGLVGARAPLPLAFTRLAAGDGAERLRGVLDALQQRVLLLLHELLTKYTRLDGELGRRLSTFGGIDPWCAAPRPLPTEIVAGLAEHRRGDPASVDVEAVRAMLEALLPGLPLAVDPEIEVAYPTPADMPGLGHPQLRLGLGAFAGSEVRAIGGVLRVRIGPVGLGARDRFLPGGEEFTRLLDATEEVVGGRVQVELELLVRGGDELAARLGAARGATLGVDALVTSTPPAELRVRVPLRSQSRVQDCRYVGME